MDSLLRRNITTSLFYSSGKHSHNNIFSPTSPAKVSNSLDKKSNSRSKYSLGDTIYNIFKIIYNKEFPNILLLNSKTFLRNINIESEELIRNNIIKEVYLLEDIKSLLSIAKDRILIYIMKNFLS